ncbi:hypothetical protein JXC34_05700 [Candidatus Woesearchaeota archaeon]|nr:hypothetical protein [Candidatus Woesearchaeota archaeon]
MDFKKLILEAEEALLSEFKIKPEKTQYFVYQSNQWTDFIKRTNSHPQALDIYLPRTLSAHIYQDSVFLPVTFLHVYFGHGLFCEHSLIGRNIVSLDQHLAELEKEMLGAEELPEPQHFKIKVPNEIANEHKKRKNAFLSYFSSFHSVYEGFGYWLEHFLSKRFNLESLFEKKMDEVVHPEYKRLFEKYLGFSQELGNFALIAELGFPKFFDDALLIDTLSRIYKDDFSSIDLTILYGSQKPYSDIDFFIISDKITAGYNHWLDIYARTPEEFEEELALLSIAVTDPLFSGKTIMGKPEYQEQLRQRVLDMPITEEAIRYNLAQSEEQGKNSLTYPEGSRERRTAQNYQESYRRNAEELMKGNKMLTFK